MLTTQQLRLRREGRSAIVGPLLSGPNATSFYTPNLMLEEPARGDYVNTWDTPMDASLTTIDNAFGSEYSFATPTSGGTVTLTVAQAANYSICIGQGEGLGGDVSVIFPAIGGRRSLRTNLSNLNGHNIFVKGSADSYGIVINAHNMLVGWPLGILVYPWRVFWAGYDVAPPGTIIDYAAAGGCPPGWLPCDGQSYAVPGGPSAPTGPYYLLWSYISGAGASVTVPDLRGLTTVGADNMNAVTGSAGRLGPWAGTGIGGNVGENAHTLAAAEMPVHNHGASDGGHQHVVNLTQSPHNHGDPGHTHSVNEAPHSHTVANIALGSGVNIQPGSGFNQTGTVGTSAVMTGLSIYAAGTGIQAANANIGITAQNGNGAGNWSNLGYASITIANAGSGGGHNIIQLSRTVLKIIRM